MDTMSLSGRIDTAAGRPLRVIAVWGRDSERNLLLSHEVTRLAADPIFHAVWEALERAILVSVGEFVPR